MKSIRKFPILSLMMLCLLLLLVACSQDASTQANGSGDANSTTTASASGTNSDFPNKPIKLIVPYAPGGGTDIAARTVANAASKYLPNGQSIVVENITGGGGTIGSTAIAKAAPDGYTLGMLTTGGITIKPYLGKTEYSYDSFSTIIQLNSIQNVLVVRNDAPWQTFEEWLEYVKDNPNSFTYGTSGTGLTQHINMEAINVALDIKTKHVPFEGEAPALTALLGGHIQGALVQEQAAKPYTDSGELRLLANTGIERPETYKDMPTLIEKGIDVGYDVWNGIAGPKGLPEDVKMILHDALKKASEDPEVIEQFKKMGIEVVYSGPEDFQKILDESYEKNGIALKAAGLID